MSKNTCSYWRGNSGENKNQWQMIGRDSDIEIAQASVYDCFLTAYKHLE